MLTVIVLTYNEERHLARCLGSVAPMAHRIVVVDSLSTDGTVSIAKSFGADVIQRPFVNQSDQFNWALGKAGIQPGWVLRLDADEYIDEMLLAALKQVDLAPGLGENGYSIIRRIKFMGRELRYGGLGSIRTVRLFRFGYGRSEERWMDEHIVIEGPIGNLPGRIVDHNLNNLTWWVAKHNGYASREVIDLCQSASNQSATGTAVALHFPTRLKRWVKRHVFYKLPAFVAPTAYFLIRYCVLLGCLDGRAGLHFHFHQGLWYRLLVISKLHEVEYLRREYGISLDEALFQVTGKHLNQGDRQ